MSAATISIGLPSALPPYSAAICAASTEPAPPRSEKGPLWSPRMPILIDFSPAHAWVQAKQYVG